MKALSSSDVSFELINFFDRIAELPSLDHVGSIAGKDLTTSLYPVDGIGDSAALWSSRVSFRSCWGASRAQGPVPEPPQQPLLKHGQRHTPHSSLV